jgi:hypothetical protein
MGHKEQRINRLLAGCSTGLFLMATMLLNTGLTIVSGSIPLHKNGTTIYNKGTTDATFNSTCLEDLDKDGGFTEVGVRGYLVVLPVILAMLACAKLKLELSHPLDARMYTKPRLLQFKWPIDDPEGLLFHVFHFATLVLISGFGVRFLGVKGRDTRAGTTTRYDSACHHAAEDVESGIQIKPQGFIGTAFVFWLLGYLMMISRKDRDSIALGQRRQSVRDARAAAAEAHVKGGGGVKKMFSGYFTTDKYLRGMINLVIFVMAFVTVMENLTADASCGMRNQAFYLGVLLYPTCFGAIWGLNPSSVHETVFKPSRTSLMLVASAVFSQLYISAVRECPKQSGFTRDAVPLINFFAILAWLALEGLTYFRLADVLLTGMTKAAAAAVENPLGEKEGGSGEEQKEGRGRALLRSNDMSTLRLTTDGPDKRPSSSLQFV